MLAGAEGVAVASAVVWAYLPTLSGLAARWSADPRYSHGFLVPGFAAVLLWSRRDERPAQAGTAAVSWCGVGLLAASAALHLAGVRYFVPWAEATALVPALAGVGLVFGGAAGFRWAAPALAFLLFMVPLPYRVEAALGEPLRGVATWCSTVALQTLGLSAFAEGDVITVNDARIGVVEACNGLGMLVTFTAMATGLALLARRPWPESGIIVLSAVPIALAANVARITATGVLYATSGAGAADAFYHDLAGWLMMPVAVGLLGAELRLLGLIFVAGPGTAAGEKPVRIWT